jgi:cytoskeletal protein CcmA (bactofilin family)
MYNATTVNTITMDSNLGTTKYAVGAKRVVTAFFIASATFGSVTLRPAGAQSPNIKDSTATAQSPLGTSGNKYAAGGQVRTHHIVVGDFFAAGGQVVVDQPVKGDANLAGGSVNVNAPIGDDLRIAGGDVNINSTVGGELVASGGNITLGNDARIAGAASIFAGSVTINGNVMGPLNVRAQTITLNGEVGGDARLEAAHIKLGPTAKIVGSLSYTSPTDIEKAEGTSISGATTREDRRGGQHGSKSDRARTDKMQGNGTGWQAWIFIFFALLACSVVFLFAFPKFVVGASDSVKKSPWLSLGLGFGALVAVPFFAVLLFMTVLGMPIGMMVMALYPALILAGFVIGVLFVARFIESRMRNSAPESTIGIGGCVHSIYQRRLVAPVSLTT